MPKPKLEELSTQEVSELYKKGINPIIKTTIEGSSILKIYKKNYSLLYF